MEELDSKLNEDLDMILGCLAEAGETISTSEEPEISQDINLLDKSENESEVNVETPESLLNQYSDYDLEIEKLDVKIEEIKALHPEIFEEISKIESQKLEIGSKQAELKNQIKQSLIDNEQKAVSNDFWKVTYVAAYDKTTFDREKFEAKYPVLAKQFITVSQVSDSTRWTRKKK